MKKLFLAKLLTIIAFSCFSSLQAEYPEKPITIIVHSKPGSGIDITARQLALLANKYIDTPILVENKTGGSGAIAMRNVLHKKANGYTILAVTKSFISTVLITSSDISMDDFYFFACMVIDPEVLITNRHADVFTFAQIIADAKAKNGGQKWLGPLVGGVDHLMAVKVWDKLGIKAVWIPYEGGADALAALMGKHGVVYVGNPVDVKGRPDLKIAIVSATERLREFPEIPTFLEKGCDLSNDVLWRGFAVKKGTNPQAITFLEYLFRKLSQDIEWIKFVTNTSANHVFLGHEKFTNMVDKDQKETIKYLRMAGILPDSEKSKTSTSRVVLSLVLLVGASIVVFIFTRKKWLIGETVIALILIMLSLFLYFVTMDFPVGKLSKTVGPASMPQLLIYALIVFCLVLIFNSVRKKVKVNSVPKEGSILKVVILIVLMTGYLLIINYLGYFISTFIFLISGIYLMSYRKHWLIFTVVAGFLIIVYIAFLKILQIPLPKGIIFE